MMSTASRPTNRESQFNAKNPIPPRSVVRLTHIDPRLKGMKEHFGRRFRIGYYACRDGLDVIWLVNEKGVYEQTIDHDFLMKHYTIERLSKETDFRGVHKRRLGRLPAKRSSRHR